MRYNNLIFFILLFFYLDAQEDLSYQSPPKKILELIDVTLPPRVLIDEKKEYIKKGTLLKFYRYEDLLN